MSRIEPFIDVGDDGVAETDPSEDLAWTTIDEMMRKAEGYKMKGIALVSSSDSFTAS